jgi:hypothetical protein
MSEIAGRQRVGRPRQSASLDGRSLGRRTCVRHLGSPVEYWFIDTESAMNATRRARQVTASLHADCTTFEDFGKRFDFVLLLPRTGVVRDVKALWCLTIP